MEDTKQSIMIENVSVQQPKLVNQGTFGCIYKPSFLCDGNTIKEEDYITKIQTKDDISEQEEVLGNKIKELRNASEYFAGIINTCPIELSKIEDNELKKCEFIEKQTSNETPQEYIASTIKYVGKQDMMDYFMERVNKPQQYVMSLFHIHFHLLKALSQLQEANIIHYDLKSNNIMVHDVKKTPIMIDFGISFEGESKPEDATNAFYVYGPNYSPWCVDIHLISYAFHKIKSEKPLQEQVQEEQTQQVIKDYMDNNSAVDTLTNTEKTEMQKAWTEYLSSYIGQPWENLYDALWNARWSWDNYAIALIMLKYTRGEFKIRENEFNQQYVKMLKQIIKATPDTRLDAKNAKEKLLEVMKMSKQEKRELIESSKETMLKDREHNMLTYKKQGLLETRHTQ
jgi:tRNA A-37 threonylcarbamoyl transferase component Bud32